MTSSTSDHQDDPATLLPRRRVLQLAGMGAAGVVLVACGKGDDSTAGSTTTTTAASGGTAETPEETNGPYPADGTNGPDVLTESGIVRSDIRSSFGDLSGTADGVPLKIRFQVVTASTGAALAGAAVYVWHCTRDGEYSLYTDTTQNYLRGVQETGSDGTVTFQSIFPGAYSGRWPHVHFEVYPSLDEATSAGTKLLTSQIAMPEDACDAAYVSDGYESSVTNLARTSLQSDMVFADSYQQELGTMSGTTGDDDLMVTLAVGV